MLENIILKEIYFVESKIIAYVVPRFGTFLGLAHAAMTAEGDNSVLMQKVAKERLAAFKPVKEEEGTVNLLIRRENERFTVRNLLIRKETQLFTVINITAKTQWIFNESCKIY